MPWMIGVDEAGYGPNLGPLAVAATVWQVGVDPFPDCGRQSAREVDLYVRLADVVTSTLETPDDGIRLVIADSKKLYQPKGGLRRLELGVLTALSAPDPDAGAPASWCEMVARLGADPCDCLSALPWHDSFDCPLPVDAAESEIAQTTESFVATAAAVDARLQTVQARLVVPQQFNALSEKWGTKGAALSHTTLELVRQLVDRLPALEAAVTVASGHRNTQSDARRSRGEDNREPTRSSLTPADEAISITLDKHGGRNRYAGVLQHHFPNSWIEPIIESRAESRYHWEHQGRPIQACFRMRGESALATALASMTAKYCRELSMRAWNEFWARHVPGIRPTAGYPGDAKRFKAEITAAQHALGIEDDKIWRVR